MAQINFSDELRTLRAQQLINLLDASVTPGYFQFFTADKPAKGVAITTQTLIGTLELSDPSASVQDGVTTFDIIFDDLSADDDGDIVWARGFNGDGGFVADFDCGVLGDDAAFIFNTLTARQGGIIQILSIVLTEGNN